MAWPIFTGRFQVFVMDVFHGFGPTTLLEHQLSDGDSTKGNGSLADLRQFLDLDQSVSAG